VRRATARVVADLAQDRLCARAVEPTHRSHRRPDERRPRHAEVGDEPTAVALSDEGLALLRELPQVGFGVFSSHTIAWMARTFGRETEARAILEREKAEAALGSGG